MAAAASTAPGEGGFAAAGRPAPRLVQTHARAALGQVADLLGRARGGASGAPVLHLGAGTGILTGQLHRAGVRLVAAELDPDARAHLVRALPGVPVLAADGSALPLANASLGALLISDRELLERRDVLVEAARVLADGAALVRVEDRPVEDPPAATPALDGFAGPERTQHERTGPDGGPRCTEVTVWRRAR